MRQLAAPCLLFSLAASVGGCAVPDGGASSPESDEPALTSNWKPMLTCDGGAAVLDVNVNERRSLQLVIRDANIVRYLNQAGAVASPFGANEIVVSGWTGRVNWSDGLGPRLEAQPYGGTGVFYAGDFREMIANHNTYEGGFGQFVRVAREGAGLQVQFGTIEKRGCAKTETADLFDGYGTQTRCVADYSAYSERANWHFNDCR